MVFVGCDCWLFLLGVWRNIGLVVFWDGSLMVAEFCFCRCFAVGGFPVPAFWVSGDFEGGFRVWDECLGFW